MMGNVSLRMLPRLLMGRSCCDTLLCRAVISTTVVGLDERPSRVWVFFLCLSCRMISYHR